MLNLTKEIRASWNSRAVHQELFFAEISPVGDSKKEIAKAASLVKYNDVNRIFENEPMPGFTLCEKSLGHVSSVPHWEIIDPRGFMCKISSENLEKIIHHSGITQGLIQQKCVWAREDSGTKMQLIPVSDPRYLRAIENTKHLEEKVDMNSVQIGDTVLMQNGRTGTYLGTMHLYGPMLDKGKKVKPQTYLNRQVVEIGPKDYYHKVDVQILKVLEKVATPTPASDVVQRLNQDIEDCSAFFTSVIDSSRVRSAYTLSLSAKAVSMVSLSRVVEPRLELIEIDSNGAGYYFTKARINDDMGQLVLEDADGTMYLANHPPLFSSVGSSIYSFSVSEIADITDTHVNLTLPVDKSAKSCIRCLDFFVKFYKIAKHVKGSYYV